MSPNVCKLLFVAGLLASMHLNRASLDARTNDNWCTCWAGYTYLYYTDGSSPWNFIDQHEFSDGFAIDEGSNGALRCSDACLGIGYTLGENVCYTASSEPNQHFQIEYNWAFSDEDHDSDGSDGGHFNTGSQIFTCP
jgi:hypothetical protein